MSAASPAGSEMVCPRCGSSRVSGGVCEVCGADGAPVSRRVPGAARAAGLSGLGGPAPPPPLVMRRVAAAAPARVPGQGHRSLVLPLTLAGVGGSLVLVAAAILLIPMLTPEPAPPEARPAAAGQPTAAAAVTGNRPTAAQVAAGLEALPPEAAAEIARLSRAAGALGPDGQPLPPAVGDPRAAVTAYQAKLREAQAALEAVSGSEQGPPDDPEELARMLGVPVEQLPGQYLRTQPTGR